MYPSVYWQTKTQTDATGGKSTRWIGKKVSLVTNRTNGPLRCPIGLVFISSALQMVRHNGSTWYVNTHEYSHGRVKILNNVQTMSISTCHNAVRKKTRLHSGYTTGHNMRLTAKTCKIRHFGRHGTDGPTDGHTLLKRYYSLLKKNTKKGFFIEPNVWPISRWRKKRISGFSRSRIWNKERRSSNIIK